MIVQFPLFASSWPRRQAEFLNHIERGKLKLLMKYGSKGEFHCNCKMTKFINTFEKIIYF